MDFVFEILDKTGRKIHLSKERWRHVREYHTNVENLEEILETIQKPDKVIVDERGCK